MGTEEMSLKSPPATLPKPKKVTTFQIQLGKPKNGGSTPAKQPDMTIQAPVELDAPPPKPLKTPSPVAVAAKPSFGFAAKPAPVVSPKPTPAPFVAAKPAPAP